MKQRLGIAVALVHQPNLLLLDEPTNGLDPQGIAEMRQLILQLSRDHQKTILISSHLLYEMEQMATRMLIVHKGRKMVEGAVTALLRPEETEVVVALEAPQSWVPLVHQHPQWQALLVSAAADALHFQMHPNFIPDLNTWLVAQGARVREIRAKHSLETYFLSLTHDSAAAH
jgi:ABC-type multidrug transport system ATPase subunit